MMTTLYDKEKAIQMARNIKDEDIDFSDVAEVTDLPKMAKRGRPFARETKQQVTIRLSKDVLDMLKKTGKGWQTRLNDWLRELLMDKRL